MSPPPDLLAPNRRPKKPRPVGLSIVLDTGAMGVMGIKDFAGTAGQFCDYAKIAWGSALVTGDLADKLAAYREHQITPMLGGTLFEYAWLHDRVPVLYDWVKDLKIALEISDGVAHIPHEHKLHWIERFAKHVPVLAEIGGKQERQARSWKQVMAEQLAAGATHIVVEGREIGPVGQSIRSEFLDEIVSYADPASLIFEALERPQQVWLIKRFGANVNLANIRPGDLLTLECFRLGLKEHTLLHFQPEKR